MQQLINQVLNHFGAESLSEIKVNKSGINAEFLNLNKGLYDILITPTEVRNSNGILFKDGHFSDKYCEKQNFFVNLLNKIR